LIEVTAKCIGNKRRCIDVTSTIARTVGEFGREQRDKRRKLKTSDALIIASAIDAQLGLVSRDADMQFIKRIQLPYQQASTLMTCY